MPDDNVITIEVDAEALLRALEKAPMELKRNWAQAGKEAAQAIISVEGLRDYPPFTSANRPPEPYYIRGRGMQYKSRNDNRSERLGSQWNVRTQDSGLGYKTVIGNRASYAPYVHGTKGKTGAKGQARAMGLKGWKQIWEVAQSKRMEINRIFSLWIKRALDRAGLS